MFLFQCSKPVIALVSGACIGGGVDLICAADIRHCSEDVVFQVKEVDVGKLHCILELKNINSNKIIPKVLLQCS